MGDFGDKFRQARQSKELSLEDVSNVLKINSRMLQAIEEEHFDLLPGGVFNKGFIRAYAKHLGLDSEQAITDYLACLRQVQIDSHAGWDSEKSSPPPRSLNKDAAPAPSKPISGEPEEPEELPHLQLPRAEDVRPPRRDFGREPSVTIPWKLVAVMAIIAILAAVLWTRHSRSGRIFAPRPSVAAAPPAVVATSVSTTAPARAPGVSAPTKQPSSEPTKTAPDVHPLTPASSTEARVVEKNDVTIHSFGDLPAKPSEKSTAPLTLVIRATENSWVSVTSDGQLISQETLIAPAHTSVRANSEIVARIGNAAGVTFLWNGKEIPAQGVEGEAKTFTFDSSGLHIAQAPQNP